MQVEAVEVKIGDLKPQMKRLDSIRDINISFDLTVQVKADGEFTKASYNRVGFKPNVRAHTLNQWGKVRTDFTALNQLEKAMDQTTVKEAEFLCELYAKEGNTPLKLPQFIHYVKSKNPLDHDKIHMGIWDILTLDSAPVALSYLQKYQTAEAWFKNCTNVTVLPYTQPKTFAEIETFWKVNVEGIRYEGIVARSTAYGMPLKVKPTRDVDAVIIGINKKSSSGRGNLFSIHQVTSIHLALMLPNGNFVEIGDCASGIDHPLRTALWKLMNYKIGEDDQRVYVKPLVIAQLEYTDLFRGKNKIYQYDGTLKEAGTMNLIRMKEPRLTCFRPDKKVNPTDLRLQQIPQEYIVKED
jgi:hypothetical protein